jgi:hypothetical protein
VFCNSSSKVIKSAMNYGIKTLSKVLTRLELPLFGKYIDLWISVDVCIKIYKPMQVNLLIVL